MKKSNENVQVILNFIERVGNSDKFGKAEQLNFKHAKTIVKNTSDLLTEIET